MSTTSPISGEPRTLEELLMLPEAERFHEVLDGQVVRKPMPSGPHGHAQLVLGHLLKATYEVDEPDGWWLATEVEVLIPTVLELKRPDLVGWRRSALPELTDETPVKVRPDWICEVVSPSWERSDLVTKRRDYAAAGIPNYWMVELRTQQVTALRLVGAAYELDRVARPGDRVRLQPFEQVEIPVVEIFRRR